jgi:hypothetical protein
MCSHENMRALTIADSANIILGLQDEIRRSEESRSDHRLHGVLLVAQGLTCPEVAMKPYGDYAQLLKSLCLASETESFFSKQNSYLRRVVR